MLTSTRLPSGGTIFANSRAVAGQNRRHLVGADVAGLGHVDDEVGHAERDDRQHDEHHRADVQRAAHPLPVDLARLARRPSVVAAAATGRPAAVRRSGGGGWRAGSSAAAVPSSAALTTSIGSRNCGSMSSRTGGRIVVGRTSGGHRRRARRAGSRCRRRQASSPTVWRRYRRRGAPTHRRPLTRAGCQRLTGPGALRYSLAVRAPLRAVRVPRVLRAGRRARRAEHVRLDQVIPTAGPAYLHHMYCELVESGRQQHQFLGGTR